MNKLKNLLVAIGFMNIWLIAVGLLYKVAYPTYATPVTIYQWNNWNLWWEGMIMSPLVEELFFRVLPITLSQKYLPEMLWTIIGASSLFFGYYHQYGYWAYPIQGMMGLVSSWLYLRNNNSYISSVVFHAGYNFLCYFGYNLLANVI